MSGIRVIHVIPRPDGGGAERLVRELTDRLPSHGIDTSAIFFFNPRGVKLTEKENVLGNSGPRSLNILRKLRHEIEKERLSINKTIIHGHLTWPLYFLPLALIGLSLTKVYTEHGTYNKRRDYRFLRPMERMIYSNYQAIICNSDGTKKSLDAWLDDKKIKNRTEVVLNGSRCLQYAFRSERDASGINIVSVGSLKFDKGFDVGMRAVAVLDSFIKSYTIVGDGPEKGKLAQLAMELNIQNKVHFTGYVDDITPYLHAADLGLIPSRWEGFGLIAVEALSTGLPLVVSDVPGLNEVVNGCSAACLANTSDLNEFVNSIRFAINHLVGKPEIGLAAQKHALQFGVEPMVERYADLYRDILHC